MAIYSIYGLIDPINKELFYIGQTLGNKEYRLIAHMGNLKNSTTPVYLRIIKIKNSGQRPLVVRLKQFESELCNLTNTNPGLFFEKIYIEEFSSLGTLLNIHQNPLYDKATKTFLEPKDKKYLLFKDGNYYIKSEVINSLHTEPYNPFKNERFLNKLK